MTYYFIGAFRHFERAVYQHENIINTHGNKQALNAAIQTVETCQEEYARASPQAIHWF